MRSLIAVAFAGLSLLATAAAAGDLDSAVLRGSRAYEAAPSYQVFPSAPIYPAAVSDVPVLLKPVAAVSGSGTDGVASQNESTAGCMLDDSATDESPAARAR